MAFPLAAALLYQRLELVWKLSRVAEPQAGDAGCRKPFLLLATALLPAAPRPRGAGSTRAGGVLGRRQALLPAAAPRAAARAVSAVRCSGWPHQAPPGAARPTAGRLRLRGRAGSCSLSPHRLCFVSLHRSRGRSAGRLPASAPRKRCH